MNISPRDLPKATVLVVRAPFGSEKIGSEGRHACTCVVRITYIIFLVSHSSYLAQLRSF